MHNTELPNNDFCLCMTKAWKAVADINPLYGVYIKISIYSSKTSYKISI